ncbi:MAG: hypothetical protein QOC96_3445 [Acidobacteriota bacterium]|nr:hypothetical protein [Acidobacteriota bacterium]
MATPLAVNQLALVPLGAGDLIDRAVRLYRRHFMTLIRIAAPPVIINTLGSLLFTLGGLSTWSAGGVVLLSLLMFLIQVGLNVIVIGGASRNLITHLFWNEPFSARNAYRNVRARFGSLLGAAILMAFWILLAMFIALLVWAFVVRLFIFGSYTGAEVHSWFAMVLLIVWILAVTFLAFLLFFLMVKFIAYVPQVLMIEGRGVFDSVGRSFTLARGNLRRLMAMALFYWFATYSALMILIVPLFWYGSAQGINISPNAAVTWPTWFTVGYSVLTQISAILIVPVLMLGLSLMYVDERVRQEGYDIELMAARQLTMPNFYGTPNAASQHAAVRQPSASAANSSQYYSPGSTLGLR